MKKGIKEIKWFVRENTWLKSSGASYIMDIGWGNGYAIIPKGFPGFGMDYDEIHSKFDIYAPGGLTFSGSGEEVASRGWSELDEKFRNKNYWIVGFDTAHYGDTLAMWPKERVEKYAAELAFQFFELALLQERNKKPEK